MGEEIRERPLVEFGLPAGARIEQLEPAAVEAAMEAAEQLQSERCQHLIGALDLRAENLDLRPRLLAQMHAPVCLDIHPASAYALCHANLTVKTSHC